MADPHVRAAFYLSPTLDEWWRWSDDARVLVWPDDRTIAFQPEVEAVLGRLAGGGLPPFGAVALLLAACREGWADSPGRETVAAYAKAYGRLGTTGASPRGARSLRLVFGRVAAEMDRLLDGLDAVGRLPQELRRPPEAKAVLAEVVFEGAANRGTPEDAALVLRAFDDGLVAATLRPQLRNEESLAQFARHADGLAAGLARVDAAALARRLKTGLDEPVRPAEADDVAPPERVRRLLAGLRADPELGGLARLAGDLMAAVTVPRSLRARDELELAGAADLSNRGPLDRLLVSELAHDDLTLAVRVAANEALYLRRESPPREPPHRRALLLDAGVRTWGVPRVFAAAVALALGGTADAAGELQVFRPTADGRAEPVDLTTRDGLERHLAALETSAHPGGSLAAFVAAAGAAEGAHKPRGSGAPGEATPVDLFVVTHAAAAADPAFAAAVRAAGPPPLLYVAAVDRDGAFRLSARTPAGEVPIRQAKLSLDALLAKPRAPEASRPLAGVPLVAAEARRDDLPALFFADPFPLLLPHRADPRRAAVSAAHGVVAATADGRLLHWRTRDRGARQLTAALPRGTVEWVAIEDATATARVLLFRRDAGSAVLVLVDLDGGRCNAVNLALSHPAPRAAFAWAGALYLVHRRHVEAFDWVDGTPLASAELPVGLRWHRGRYFRDGRGFYAVGHDGTATLRLVKVPEPPKGLADVLDDPTGGSPLLVHPDGTMTRGGATGPLLPGPAAEQEVLGLSWDGRRLAYRARHRTPGTPAAWIADLEAGGRAEAMVSDDWREAVLAPVVHWSTRQPDHLRRRVEAVGVDAAGRLVLRCAPRLRLAVDLDAAGRLALVPVGPGEPLYADQPFRPVRRTAAAPVKLQVAEWPGGCRAWLDGRGLLHLKAAGAPADVPEVTLVLRYDPGRPGEAIAAWSSDGWVCGPAFFIGDATPASGAHFADAIRRFRMRLR